MAMSEILARLRLVREEEEQELVAQARQDYGDRFAEVFKYRKGSVWYVMTSDTAIARKYRSLRLSPV